MNLNRKALTKSIPWDVLLTFIQMKPDKYSSWCHHLENILLICYYHGALHHMLSHQSCTSRVTSKSQTCPCLCFRINDSTRPESCENEMQAHEEVLVLYWYNTKTSAELLLVWKNKGGTERSLTTSLNWNLHRCAIPNKFPCRLSCAYRGAGIAGQWKDSKNVSVTKFAMLH